MEEGNEGLASSAMETEEVEEAVEAGWLEVVGRAWEGNYEI